MNIAAAPSLDRAPVLTMPEAEAAFLRAGYTAAKVILEYGSGGSTAMAADMAGKTIWSVESDKRWMLGLQDWFSRNKPAATLHMRYANIGPTAKWGFPKDDSKWARYHRYPLDVWADDGFLPPDTVLIDGRFRVACYLAVLFMTPGPVTVYFDDYLDRPHYHVIERFGAPAEIVGRMARFDLTPQTIAPRDLAWIMDKFTRPQ